MSDLEKAARMALGALESMKTYAESTEPGLIVGVPAIDALRRALEQTALCKYGNEPTSCTSSPMDCQCALDAVFEQPAQQQEQAMLDALVGGTGIMKNGKRIDPESVRQEPAPVAHLLLKNGKKSSFWFDKGDAYDLDLSEGYEWVDLYTRPQAQQEPVAWRYKKEGGGWFVSDNDPQYVEQWNDIAEIQPLYTVPQPAQQEPVVCSVCDQVHAILDADESKIIRNAKDGYPEGRTPRVLTLQERVAALCKYAADWKRWCLEEEARPQAREPEQQAQQEPVAYCNNTAIERLRNEPGDWMLIYGRPQHPHTVPLYARPQAREPLTDEQIAKALAAAKLLPEDYREDGQIEPLVRAIEAAHGITSGEATLGEKK